MLKGSAVLFVIMLLVNNSPYAQLPPVGYMCLYKDDTHIDHCVTGTVIYEVEMRVWCFPSERGMKCAEFSIRYPSNVIPGVVNYNSNVGFPPGGEPSNPADGVTLCYESCQWDWNWIFYQSVIVTSYEITAIEIAPHPVGGWYKFASCEEGNPFEPIIRCTNFDINNTSFEICVSIDYVGTNEYTWGAIKSLYKE